MGRKTCSVLSCYNRKGPNRQLSMFSFPIDPDLCEKWVEFCQTDELNSKLVLQGPAALRNTRFICSDHFESICFRNPCNTAQGLRTGSIPTISPESLRQRTEKNMKPSITKSKITNIRESSIAEIQTCQIDQTDLNGSTTTENEVACQCAEVKSYKTKLIEERNRGTALVKECNILNTKMKEIRSSGRAYRRAIKRVQDSIENLKSKMRRIAEQRNITLNFSSDETDEDNESEML
ncbi:52 kDa repressor of the inhibitor of the protein kinase-like [Wyeomyia smithii]|uniref:52 kDa repressor of the inhibitor of the protein kinase-like n=1 Tax=Wyeomyia smithii TaxID=174621 RepID=UPI002467DFAC|nr:52 kDa repressor of the inhibitor of the protein kinase-like [Wyeomyia smithii]